MANGFGALILDVVAGKGRTPFLQHSDQPAVGDHLRWLVLEDAGDLDEPVEGQSVLLAQATGAAAHGCKSVGGRAAIGGRPAYEKLADCAEQGQIVLAHHASEFGNARPGARTVAAHQSEEGISTCAGSYWDGRCSGLSEASSDSSRRDRTVLLERGNSSGAHDQGSRRGPSPRIVHRCIRERPGVFCRNESLRSVPSRPVPRRDP